MLARRLLPGGVTAIVSTTLEAEGFLVAFLERTGGVSVGVVGGLNLGFRTPDDPERVARNRGLACRALGISSFAVGRQVHGARCTRVGPGRAGAGFADPATALPGTDALVTRMRGVPIAVLAADCVPVALADPRSGITAVAHAGWRGMAGGVLQRTLAAFPDLRSVHGAVGPAVGADHYPVGAEVEAAVSAATRGGAVARRGRGAIHLDLAATAATILEDAGVRTVDRAEECTACHPGRFFSHRRDGRTGRQALIAVRLA